MRVRYMKIIICVGCGVEHSTRKDGKVKYCSAKCGRRFQPKLVHSEESKRKIRESNIKTWSKVYPLSKRRARTERQDAIRKRPYREWRLAVFVRDNYSCVDCGISGAKAYLEADHIKQWAFYPELRYDVDNGRTLCKDCHATVTAEQRKLVLA